MKTLLALMGALFLCGCATAHRVSAPPQEVFTTFTVRHKQSAGQAFLNVERALAESYNDLPAVLKLRQPETGTLLLRPLVPYRVGGAIGPIEHCRYSLKITVAANSFPLDFKLEPEGYWPPSAEIRKITEHFRKLAQAVADSVGGELQPVAVP